MDNFKMAYLISCHKNVDQVNSLISQLDYKNVDFYIHVDKKSNILDRIIQKENIFFIKERIEVVWGDSSQVMATLKLMEAAKYSGVEYQYIHLLSGQDYPLKSNQEIEDFFKKHMGKQFIDCTLMEKNWLRRVYVYYPRVLMGNKLEVAFFRAIYSRVIMLTFIFRRRITQYPHFYQGSSWFSITGDAMLYIVDYLQKNPDFLKFINNTLCCDEFVFQTILGNSIYKDKLCENMRYIDWSEKKSSPKILRECDLQDLIKSNKIFARKFDSSVDNNIIGIISENISLESVNIY